MFTGCTYLLDSEPPARDCAVLRLVDTGHVHAAAVAAPEGLQAGAEPGENKNKKEINYQNEIAKLLNLHNAISVPTIFTA